MKKSSRYISTDAEMLLSRFYDFYNPDKHLIDINKVDWDNFRYNCVNLKEIDEEIMEDLLSGRLTKIVNLTGGTKTGKLRIYKDEHGKLTNIVIPTIEKCNIPDKIFNYTLSEEEKNYLCSKGRLDKSIQVVIEKSKQLILPFIDHETNQVMYRCMNLVKIPDKFRDVKVLTEHVKTLISGGAYYIVVDNRMEKVFIDPETGKITNEIVKIKQ